jgi:hypothetical protein
MMIRITIGITSNYSFRPKINASLRFKICSKIIVKIGSVLVAGSYNPMIMGPPWNHQRNKKDEKSGKSLSLHTTHSGFQNCASSFSPPFPIRSTCVSDERIIGIISSFYLCSWFPRQILECQLILGQMEY